MAVTVRTNSDAVKALLGGNYDDRAVADGGSPSLTPFMEMAAMLVNRVETCADEDADTALSDDELEMLERMLAAHFYQSRDQGVTSESNLSSSSSYKGQFTEGLKKTTYGQDALDFDSSGCLAAITGGRGTASFAWLGKRKSAQTPYDQRD